MLTLRFEVDKALLSVLYGKLGLNEAVAGANFVFIDDGADVGLWRAFMERVPENGAVIYTDKIAFLDAVDADDRKFFFHAMLFKLQQGASAVLRINGEYKQLEPYGFAVSNGNSETRTDKINLHPYCKG